MQYMCVLLFPKQIFTQQMRRVHSTCAVECAVDYTMLFVVDAIVIFTKALPFVIHSRRFQQLVLNSNRYCCQAFDEGCIVVHSSVIRTFLEKTHNFIN